MKKAEQFLIGLIILGFIADSLLITGGKWVLIIGIGFLANVYLFDFNSIIENLSLSDYNKKSKLPTKFELSKMIPGYAIVSLLLGMLFRFKTWPGGDTVLMVGFALSIVGIYILQKKLNSNRALAMGGIKRIVIFAVLGVGFYILPNYFWLENTYKNYPEYIEARKNLDKDPENETLLSKMEEAYELTK